jgi:threonine dehydrogenase-like Zn-dependent dehydrogenase
VLGIVGRFGAFAEWLTLPVENLHVVPEEVPDEVAVFTEPLAAALRIGEQVAIAPGDRVLVVGAGRLGQLVARSLALGDADPVVVARHPDKRRLLADAGVEARAPEDLPDGPFDLVVECTGNPAGFEIARGRVRPGGTIVLKSTYARDLTLDASALAVDEITLVGSRCGPFAPALAFLASGAIDPRPLIHDRFPLAEAPAAFARAAESGVLKVLVEP